MREHIANLNLSYIYFAAFCVHCIQEDIQGLPCDSFERIAHRLQECIMIALDHPGKVEQPFFVTESKSNNVAVPFEFSSLAGGIYPARRVPANPGIIFCHQLRNPVSRI
jgi:hypothetical protein